MLYSRFNYGTVYVERARARGGAGRRAAWPASLSLAWHSEAWSPFRGAGTIGKGKTLRPATGRDRTAASGSWRRDITSRETNRK